jgi:hypothetical protein
VVGAVAGAGVLGALAVRRHRVSVARGTPVSRQNAAALCPLAANARKHAVFSAAVHGRRRRAAGAARVIEVDMRPTIRGPPHPVTTCKSNAYGVMGSCP